MRPTPKPPRPDWAMPLAPNDRCYHCGEPIVPLAYGEEEGWALYWSCHGWDSCGDISGPISQEEIIIPWPWADDEPASADDLAALGFTVV